MYVTTCHDESNKGEMDMIYTGNKRKHYKAFSTLIHDIVKSHEECTMKKSWETLALSCPVGDFNILIEKNVNNTLKIFLNGSIMVEDDNGN